MKTIEIIESTCKNKFIEVIQDENGIYHLKRYETKFDPEEEKLYTIAHLPHPRGRYDDLDSAVAEAKVLLK
jgi:hypothetical protein